MQDNLILKNDYYKATHHLLYPSNTEHVYSYAESRGGKFNDVLFFGLQMYLKSYLCGSVITQAMIDEADYFLRQGFGFDYFNRNGWQYILDVHAGTLPIKIKAVPEGMVVPVKNILLSIENTDPKVPWLTNFVETSLLRGIWYPTTVATLGYHIKKVIERYCLETGCQLSPFHLNDFGARGVSSGESAGIGGCSHLVNFMGTDTIEGVRTAMKYYSALVCGFSVMASEHSCTTIFGKEKEADAYSHFLDVCPDNAILSVVVDSYDTINAVQAIFGGKLRDRVLKRNGKVVFRPDSGDPVEMSVCVVNSLWKVFGGTYNERGYRVLNPKVGCIYGDGINIESIDLILKALKDENFAASNIIFGCGGELLQKPHRDMQKFALKCSAARINGKWVDVYKDPVTDDGKKSKRGRLKLIKDNGQFITVNSSIPGDDQLITVFENGKLLIDYQFDKIRERATQV